MVKETTKYDNYLDSTKRVEDEYSSSLEHFLDKEVPDVLQDETKAKKNTGQVYKSIYVHFRSLEDLEDFCNLIHQPILITKNEFKYIQHDPVEGFKVDTRMIRNPKFHVEESESLFDAGGEDTKWKMYWKYMPEYEQEDNPSYRSITMKFPTKEDYKDFQDKIGQKLSDRTKSIWHPKLYVTKNAAMRWVQDVKTEAQYPLYIVSKGRYDTMGTSRSLARMEIPHYIVIEPQEQKKYEEALETFGLRDSTTLLVAPFSNHGDGPGRARNWAWDHSISIGAKAHWVLDDNIADFYRLHQNLRVRVESGVFFRAMEDFVDRYDNIPIAGPQYRFFCAPDQKYPPLVFNTRIYSTLLIRNDCKHRWRGRYNEDTDICLRVLKDGDCTVQFNAFLQGKAATQTVKGGNTEEFYHKETYEKADAVDKKVLGDKIGFDKLNREGTINKSQMLVDMHPDVVRLVYRYNRWHHWVDYSPFKGNKPHMREGVEIPEGNNNYGMYMIKNYDYKNNG